MQVQLSVIRSNTVSGIEAEHEQTVPSDSWTIPHNTTQGQSSSTTTDGSGTSSSTATSGGPYGGTGGSYSGGGSSGGAGGAGGGISGSGGSGGSGGGYSSGGGSGSGGGAGGGAGTGGGGSGGGYGSGGTGGSGGGAYGSHYTNDPNDPLPGGSNGGPIPDDGDPDESGTGTVRHADIHDPEVCEGYYPLVHVYVDFGEGLEEVWPEDIIHVDLDTTIIKFTEPQVGRAKFI